MVLAVIGHVLLARNLNLNIRMGAGVVLNLASAMTNSLLLSVNRVLRWAVEVLSRLIHILLPSLPLRWLTH